MFALKTCLSRKPKISQNLDITPLKVTKIAYLISNIFLFIVNAGKTPILDKHGKKGTSTGIVEDLG